MKFPVDECGSCCLDLTTAEPAKVIYFEEKAIGQCPGCGRTYEMEEAPPPPSPEPEPVSGPEVDAPEATETEVEEPVAEPGSESESAAEPESEPEPEVEPE